MNFGTAIKGLIHLLGAVGERGWHAQLQQHLATWERTGDASGHLSIYGGVGSFNDIMICVMNHHTITAELEPFANETFRSLSSISYMLARGTQFRAKDWEDKQPGVLQGGACRSCAHGEITGRDIDDFLSQRLIQPMICQGMLAGDVVSVVDNILRLNILGLTESRENTRQKALRSGISLSDREVWMRFCPFCGSADTCVYRWVDRHNTFEPAPDNLKLKNK